MRFLRRNEGTAPTRFALCLLLASLVVSAVGADEPAKPAAKKVMVQAETFERAVEIVEEVGGEVTHRLKIIRAAGTALTPEQRERAAKLPGFVRFFEDRTVEAAS